MQQPNGYAGVVEPVGTNAVCVCVWITERET